jgi:uncharacterized protein
LIQKIQAIFLYQYRIFAQNFCMEGIAYIKRTLEHLIAQRLFGSPNKIILVYGQRQVGKTTLIKRILAQQPQLRVLSINADIEASARILESRDLGQFQLLLSGYDVLFIDEAQRVHDIGINLKIIHDHFPQLRVVVTGSSSFELANQIQEPLTGRTWSFHLHPLSAAEICDQTSRLAYANKLEEWLIYGQYPGVLQLAQANDKRAFLTELTQAYLYKDLLELAHIKHSRKLRDCLQLLALQLGQEVSYHELGRQLQLDAGTVGRYIDLLEKCFIIKPIRGFSQNERKEITKKQKIYFYDLGIRNALIERFAPTALRDDGGALWENFLFMERNKHCTNHEIWMRQYFWRLQSGAEVDYVEVIEGKPAAFEFKSKNTFNIKPPAAWSQNYPEAPYTVVHKENWLPFVLGLDTFEPEQL